MSHKRTLLVGTAVLTATGFLSRIIGFFFRMFLSHSFGEEQVGLYQLIFPLYALCFSFTSAGIETAIARCTARKVSLGKKEEAILTLYIGLCFSLLLSFLSLIFLQHNASSLAIYILGDIRCERMLVAISYAIPFAAIHSCICGYYLGLRQTKIPASSQLIEQLVRTVSSYIIFLFATNKGQSGDILLAVFGIVIGECASSLYCINRYTTHTRNKRHAFLFPTLKALSGELLTLSAPLTASRIFTNLLQSVESISIPLRLQQFGYTSSQALSNYGVLTGMALPCVLFPSALTNSVSTMLLPTVAELQTQNNNHKLKDVIKKVFYTCLTLGAVCSLIFLSLGSLMGRVLFHSMLAGNYLRTLAFLCPFLYLGSTLGSIQTGLGRAHITFLINIISVALRILGVLVFIPMIGMNGYLWALLASQIVSCSLHGLFLGTFLRKLK